VSNLGLSPTPPEPTGSSHLHESLDSAPARQHVDRASVVVDRSRLASALPCPTGRSGPWSRRTGAPEASATRRDRNLRGVVVLVRTGSARHRKPLVVAGHERSRWARRNRRPEHHRGQDHGRWSTDSAGSNPSSHKLPRACGSCQRGGCSLLVGLVPPFGRGQRVVLARPGPGRDVSPRTGPDHPRAPVLDGLREPPL
jgi:hypothetical protein